MRIGIDLTAAWRPTTGMENVAIEMTRALLRAQKDNTYVLFFTREIHPQFVELVERFQTVLIPRYHEVFVKNVCLPFSVMGTRLDYLHFPIFPPPWGLGCHSGWTFGDATPWLYPETMKMKSRIYYSILGARAARTNPVLITFSEAARGDAIRTLGVAPERIHVIYPGLKAIFCRRNDREAVNRVRRLYSLPENFILFVGTLEPRKNLSRVLSAFRLLKTQRGFNPELVIVGRKGWLNAPIFKQLGNQELAEHVSVTGYVSDEDLVTLYNMARVLVSPSLYEGFGLPCIEAMACGCPVVTSNRGAQYEVTGACAVHCDPEDVVSIADAIQKTNSDDTLRARLITDGVRWAESFSWDRYAEQLLNIIEHSLNRRTEGTMPGHPASCRVG